MEINNNENTYKVTRKSATPQTGKERYKETIERKLEADEVKKNKEKLRKRAEDARKRGGIDESM